MHVVWVAAAVVGGAAGFIGSATVLVMFVRRLVRLLRALRSYTDAVRKSAEVQMQLAALAGSTTQLAVVLLGEAQGHGGRLDELAGMVVDLNADVIRLRRDLAKLQMTA